MSYRIGAVFYILWSLLHLMAAWKVAGLAADLDGMVQARIMQDAWFLGGSAVFGSTVAILWNWHNHPTGYWLNLLVLGFTDVSFVVLVVAPGHLPLFPHGVLGPTLYLVAAIATTVGFIQRDAPP